MCWLIAESNCRVHSRPCLRDAVGQGVQYHMQKRREPRRPSSPSSDGIRGCIAERVRPQKRAGLKSFLVAVNFQPMCEPQVRHCATVQAYLGAQEKRSQISCLGFIISVYSHVQPSSLCGVYFSQTMPAGLSQTWILAHAFQNIWIQLCANLIRPAEACWVTLETSCAAWMACPSG